MLFAVGDAFIDGRNLGVEVIHVLLVFLRHPALCLQRFLGFRRIRVIFLCSLRASDGLRASGRRKRKAPAEECAKQQCRWNGANMHALFSIHFPEEELMARPIERQSLDRPKKGPGPDHSSGAWTMREEETVVRMTAEQAKTLKSLAVEGREPDAFQETLSAEGAAVRIRILQAKLTKDKGGRQHKPN